MCNQEVAYEFKLGSYRKKDSAEGPTSRVWAALSNPAEFGHWLGVALKGKVFVAGNRMQGQITDPGYEHLTFEILIERIEPERMLSWRWHPAAIDPSTDYSRDPTTLVVFQLEKVDEGTLLSVVESGFDNIPPAR